MGTLTPMMRQYLDIRGQVPDCLLFFRLGDFYEMFFDDAVTASKILDLTLTGRDCGLEERAPMCGVPFRAVDSYIARLIEAGHKVAICEQTTLPGTGGLVEREITRIVTSGTLAGLRTPGEERNSFLACVYFNASSYAVACCDVGTGESFTRLISGHDAGNAFLGFMSSISPDELLCNGILYSDPALRGSMERAAQTVSGILTARYFDPSQSLEPMLTLFSAPSAEALGIDDDATLRACCALFSYLTETQKLSLGHVRRPRRMGDGKAMILDAATKRNLEITQTMRSAKKQGSLLGVLDRTSSAAGARTLRRWVCEPLLIRDDISARHEAVEALCRDQGLRNELAALIKKTSDLDRITSKIGYRTARGRDLLAMRDTLALLPQIKALLESCASPLLSGISGISGDMAWVVSLITDTVSEECTGELKDGKLIRPGRDLKLDAVKELAGNAEAVLAGIEAKERASSGIRNLKIRYNRVFGYYFEVSKSSLGMVPGHFVRKQTLANAERFYTPELKETEERLVSAQDDISRMEGEIFEDLLVRIGAESDAISRAARLIGDADALCSFAAVSSRNRYVRPSLNGSGVINLKGSRHPVIETHVEESAYIKNDALMDGEGRRLLVITGPNMAGKSTYIRQIALIALMSQIGCFVPADEADLCVVDQIFTRVGASDDIASGQSTFMVEMSEVSNILRNATADSLLILDEVGRGTSTYDGLSIARAVAEHVASDLLGAKCLFATHYHELTALEGTVSGAVNCSFNAVETHEGIVFTHKVSDGPSDKSYGIEVARLAGLPEPVIERAQDLLGGYERTGRSAAGRRASSKSAPAGTSLFNYKLTSVTDALKKIDVNALTPLEVAGAVARLQKELE